MNELVAPNGQHLAQLEPLIGQLVDSPNDRQALQAVRGLLAQISRANGTVPPELMPMLEELGRGGVIKEKWTITITHGD